MTERRIAVEARFLGDVETGIGPIISDSRSAQSLLTVYALALKKWLAQNEHLRHTGFEPDALIIGAVVVYLTLVLKRAWSLAVRDMPEFMDSPAGEELLYMLNKMADVATAVGGGARFLSAHRIIYEAMVDELQQRGVEVTKAVKTCFDGSNIDRMTNDD